MEDDYFSEDAATFGDRMAAAREALGLTQGKLAQKLGVKTATVAAWEADRSEPRANRLQMLAGLLNVSIMWLMTGQGAGVPHPERTDRDAALAQAVGELREARMAQQRVAARLARLEKRLQDLVAQPPDPV